MDRSAFLHGKMDSDMRRIDPVPHKGTRKDPPLFYNPVRFPRGLACACVTKGK